MELYWSCSECGSANPYPDSKECEVCGKRIDESEVSKVLEKENEIKNRIKQEENEEIQKRKLAEQERKKEENRLKKIKRNKIKKCTIAILSVFIFVAIILYFSFVQPSLKYTEAKELMESGNYPEAIDIFESLYDYKDSKMLVEECKEKQKEVNYQEAIKSFNEGNYDFARDFFDLLGDYKDCKDYIGKCDIKTLKESKRNDIITLGEYNGSTIDWIVLEKNTNDVLLVSKYYIDSRIANEKDYGKYGKYTCWSGSTLRSWLNNTFVKEAFPASVSEALIYNMIQTNEYDVANYDGWNAREITVSTDDRVYIPSINDIEKYNIKPTSLMNDYNAKLITGWLRDRGHGIAFQVSYESDGSYGSEWHFYSSYGIRPMIRVSLNGETEIHNESLIEAEEQKIKENVVNKTEDSSPFEQKYWIIFAEGYRGDRIEVSTVDSKINSTELSIVWNSSLELSDMSGSEQCNQYYLDENGQWVFMGTYRRLSDNASKVIASNLDVIDADGNVLIERTIYSAVDLKNIMN